jgi:hypothetical protein
VKCDRPNKECNGQRSEKSRCDDDVHMFNNLTPNAESSPTPDKKTL